MWARSRRAGSPVQRNVRSRELRSSSDKAILVGMARFPWDVAGSATTHHRTGPLPVQQDPDEPNLAHAFPHAGTYLGEPGASATGGGFLRSLTLPARQRTSRRKAAKNCAADANLSVGVGVFPTS